MKTRALQAGMANHALPTNLATPTDLLASLFQECESKWWHCRKFYKSNTLSLWKGVPFHGWIQSPYLLQSRCPLVTLTPKIISIHLGI